MSVNHDAANAFSVAILKAAGLPEDCEYTAVSYEHRVGDLPRLTVETVVWRPEVRELDVEVQQWVPADEVQS